MRGRTRSALRSMCEIGALFLMAAFTLSFALIHYDNEDSHNTYTISGKITNVDSTWYGLGSGLITFEVGGTNCYYSMGDAGWDDRELCYDRYKHLEMSKKVVTAIITEDWHNYVCGLLGDPSYIISLKCQFNDVQDMSDEYQRLVQLKPESIKKTSNEEIFIFKCHPVDIERYFDDKILDGTILCFEIVVFNEDKKSIEYLTAEIQDSYGKPDLVTSVLNKVR